MVRRPVVFEPGLPADPSSRPIGQSSSTRAGIEPVEKLSGITALNVLDRDSLPKLKAILERTLGLKVKSELRR
jgi:hypothetical protein